MIKKMHKAIDFVISFILWILITVLVVPLVLLLFFYKSCVIFIAQRIDKNLHPTRPNDTYFARGDIKQVPIVNVAQIWRVDGMVDLNEFRNLFQRLFISCPEARTNYLNLHCYLKQFGGYIFKKSVDYVDIEKHVVLRTLENESLEEFIVKWMVKETFLEEQPLWEIVLIYLPFDDNINKIYKMKNNDRDGKDTNAQSNNYDKIDGGSGAIKGTTKQVETVVLIKMHHCLTDGYGFIHIVDRLTGNEAPYLVEEDEESFFQKVQASFFGPKTLLEYVINVARTPDLFYPLKDGDNTKWYMSLNTLNLKTLKLVRRRTKTHFISVMMSLTIGAIRRYLTEDNTELAIPSHIWTANSLPWPDHPRTALVNHWSGGVFQVPFKTADALERLYGTENFFKFFHDTKMNKTVKRLIIPVTWCLPSALLRWGHSLDLYYFRYSNAFASLLLSEKPHYILGNRVKQLYLPLGIKDAVSTSVFFGVSTSHSGQIDLSLLASSELVMDQAALDRIANVYFAQELDQLWRSIEERVIPILEQIDGDGLLKKSIGDEISYSVMELLTESSGSKN